MPDVRRFITLLIPSLIIFLSVWIFQYKSIDRNTWNLAQEYWRQEEAFLKKSAAGTPAPARGLDEAPVVLPYTVGEKIIYDIKKMGLKVGEATLTFKGPVVYEGRPMVLVIFTSSAMNFYDEEKIHLDPVRMIPLVVLRDVNIFGKKEKIKEIYDQTQGTVRIVKSVGGETVEQSIEKTAPIENIYGFLYRYRETGTLKEGESFTLNLPTKDIVIKLKGTAKVRAADRQFNAYHLESTPKQYSLWFGTDVRRIPLRIDGSMKLGATSLIMRTFSDAGKVIGRGN